MSHKPEEPIDLGYEFLGKTKLRKGLSFPIKRSVLDEFLRREGITKVTAVGYCANSGHNVVLKADYFGSRRKSRGHALVLWIYAVPSDIRNRVEELVVNAVFPRLAKWLLSFSDDSLLRAKTDQFTSFALEEVLRGDRSASPAGEGDLRLVQSMGQRPLLK